MERPQPGIECIVKNKVFDGLKLKSFLDRKADEFNRPEFIKLDPISIPHLFSGKQDIEIAGFFAAVFAWGNRKTIIQKSKDLLQRMDMAPHDFCLNHKDKDLQRLRDFCHRTFNSTDLLYFIEFLKQHYEQYDSLEDAFIDPGVQEGGLLVESGLNHFYRTFFSLEFVPDRTRKHIAAPVKNSACKRLNMFLRWMVRRDDRGVDFGLWQKIKPQDLICPLDVHVGRVARHFQLLSRKQSDWKAALELTERLREFDPADPVRYDFALFGLGVLEKF